MESFVTEKLEENGRNGKTATWADGDAANRLAELLI